MKGSNKKEVTKKVAFSMQQMLKARDSRKIGQEGGHRKFVEWLFFNHHKLHVLDHSKLIYDYDSGKSIDGQYIKGKKDSVICVHGVVGVALGR